MSCSAFGGRRPISTRYLHSVISLSLSLALSLSFLFLRPTCLSTALSCPLFLFSYPNTFPAGNTSPVVFPGQTPQRGAEVVTDPNGRWSAEWRR